MTVYQLKSLNLPKLTGATLAAFAAAAENPALRPLLLPSLLKNGGIPTLRRTVVQEPPTYVPLVRPEPGAPLEPAAGFSPVPLPHGFPYRTAADFAAAYRSGETGPLQVAEAFLAAWKASDQGPAPLRAFIAVQGEDVLAQARASAQRIRAGKALGPLDGVPVAIKDEIDQRSYPTTVGTRFLGAQPAAADATVVARLRAAGALLVGKTNMHEIGINPDGSNAAHGSVRNPFDPARDPGGSSSGSAAAVAAGLAPIAIGADGGGSIRIPAALCGVVGLKSTFGRVSELGAAPLCWSVAHLGPLATSVEDAALVYSIIAGPDAGDPNTLVQPPVTLAGWNQAGLHGVRIGIYPEWFENATPQVVKICQGQVEQFKQLGAQVSEIEIPELNEMRIAHIITILSEMAACMQPHQAQRKLHGASTRISLALGDSLTSFDFLQAQRMRTRALAIFKEIYRQVDVILSPFLG
jgi:Asp-tRNA(Asn)/Glu-tRNA(Gln) amidotransferase A subunit family amidase